MFFCKPERRYTIRKREFIRFQWCHICPDTWNIEGDITILREITGNGKSVHRAFWKGLLTSSEMSNEWPIHREIYPGPLDQHSFSKAVFYEKFCLILFWEFTYVPLRRSK